MQPHCCRLWAAFLSATVQHANSAGVRWPDGLMASKPGVVHACYRLFLMHLACLWMARAGVHNASAHSKLAWHSTDCSPAFLPQGIAALCRVVHLLQPVPVPHFCLANTATQHVKARPSTCTLSCMA